MTTYGTSHFTSRAAAIDYYRDYGFSANDVTKKVSRGEIHIGRPTLKPGQSLQEIDDGRRYAIVEAE